MSRRKIPLTTEDHRQLGLALAAMRDEMIRIEVWLANKHLPKTHPACRALFQATKRMDQARSALENVMFTECGGQAATAGAYYPRPEDRRDWMARQAAGGVS